MTKISLLFAGLASIASTYRTTILPARELDSLSRRTSPLAGTICLEVLRPDSLPGLGDHSMVYRTLLRLREDLAPVISDTTKLPGHPRLALQVARADASPPDYAAWWPLAADSVALFWRFGIGRGVYVAAAVRGDGDLSGRLFLTVGPRHEGPIVFSAKQLACSFPGAA